MTKINSVIEPDGQRYDSRTGENSGVNNSGIPRSQTPQGRRVRSLDGFMPAPAHKRTRESVEAIPVAKQPDSNQQPIARHSVKTVNPHQPERSKTLMRHTVKAPAKPARVERVQIPTDTVQVKPKVLGVKPKVSSEVVDNGRAERASAVPRSRQVARFTQAKPASAAAAVAASTTVKTQRLADPVQVPQTQPQPRPDQDMFERAIENATSHEEPAQKESSSRKARRGVRRHARWVSITAIMLAAILLGGFIAYQNKIELQLQLASAKAGFAATMPGFRPTGYTANTLSYSPGKVAIGFAGPNSKSYKVIQKSSNWDSQTLLENFVATSGQPYDAYKASGRTVYVYGNGNATWVSGGVWYQVNDNGSLNKDQIIQLANSM